MAGQPTPNLLPDQGIEEDDFPLPKKAFSTSPSFRRGLGGGQEGLVGRSTPRILRYGCNVTGGDAGEELLTELHQLTGATVMASAKRTGNKALGGDWELEVTVSSSKIQNPKSKIPLAFRDETLAEYQSVLAQDLVPFLVKDINPATAAIPPSYLTNINGILFFRADDDIHGVELWKSDGTADGTVLVKDI